MLNKKMHTSRRKFLFKGSLGLVGLSLGHNFLLKAAIDKAANPPALNLGSGFSLKEKHPDLVVLSDKPWNYNTSAKLDHELS